MEPRERRESRKTHSKLVRVMTVYGCCVWRMVCENVRGWRFVQHVSNTVFALSFSLPLSTSVQQLTVLIMFPAKWPDEVKALGAIFEGFSIDVSIVSPTCLGIPMDFYSRFSFSAAFVFAGITAPWVVAAFVASVMACCEQARGRREGRHGDNEEGERGRSPSGYGHMLRTKWRRVQPTAARYSLIVMLFAHPAVSGQTFFFFSCHDINGVKYLIADYNRKCYDNEWLRMLPLAIFMVLFFVIGVPLLLLVLLLKYRVVIMRMGTEIDEAEAEAALVKELGSETIDVDRARALYAQVDVDHSGSIDFAEFAKFQLNQNKGEDGPSRELVDIVKRMASSKDTGEDVKSLGRKALVLMNAQVERQSSRQISTRGGWGGANIEGAAGDGVKGDGDGMRRRRSDLVLPVLAEGEGGGGNGESGGETKGDNEGKGAAEGTETTNATNVATNEPSVRNATQMILGEYAPGGRGSTVFRGNTDFEGAHNGITNGLRNISSSSSDATVAGTGESAQWAVDAHERRKRLKGFSSALAGVDTSLEQRAAGEGDGVEVMLAVLWSDFKPEFFYFDM